MPVPFYGEEFTFAQPDGTQIKVRGWGNQDYAVFETLDGFTVVKDPITGFYQYTTVSDDGQDFVPTGVQPGLVDPQRLELTKGIRLERTIAKTRAAADTSLPPVKRRWEVRRERARASLYAAMLAPGIAPAPPQRETVGDYVGLCLLIRFPDPDVDVVTLPLQKAVEDFCNQEGYSVSGNNGSVYDYFYDNSGGKLRYKNVVAPYYTAKRPRAYYIDPRIPYGKRAIELIREALTGLKSSGFDFGQLTLDDEGFLYALNVFYAGNCTNNWAEGLWPHSYCLETGLELAPGRWAFDYQITNIGSELTLGTFCHENGHMICDFPDLYDYGYQSRGVGTFCLMCSGANVDRANPTEVCAYLKYKAGWAERAEELAPGLTECIVGHNEFFILRKNLREYFIIENRYKKGRDRALPDSGLAIWHIDELGSNNDEQMKPDKHYECSLEQADGRFDLERRVNGGDSKDLFEAGDNDRFADDTIPASKWWDGTASGLEVNSISTAGKNMTFTVDI